MFSFATKVKCYISKASMDRHQSFPAHEKIRFNIFYPSRSDRCN